jgi:3-oxoacyl-(acyl-carrier-protein) synthase
MNESDLNAMGYLDALVVKPEFQDAPEQASRPFDVRRCGFVPSHGAATLVLEEYEQAKRRGATIHAEVLAVAANSNANHLPAPCGEAQAALMRKVLGMAGTAPEAVGYVNCHATGTPLGDIEELSAVKSAFGPHAKNLKLNALKSMLGHTCWAAPLVETIGGILQLAHGKLVRTTNIDEPAPEVDLDVMAAGPADTDARIMLKNSFGFGGLNCCSLLAVPRIGEQP